MVNLRRPGRSGGGSIEPEWRPWAGLRLVQIGFRFNLELEPGAPYNILPYEQIVFRQARAGIIRRPQ